MTTFQDHHIINEQFGKFINKALEGTEFKFNVNTRPANRIYLPTDSVFAGELGATRHIGKPHGASAYTKAIRVQITAIIEANSNNPAMLIQKLDERVTHTPELTPACAPEQNMYVCDGRTLPCPAKPVSSCRTCPIT